MYIWFSVDAQVIHIIGIEAIDTRYTGHWAQYVPDLIAKNTGLKTNQIMGEILDTTLDEGAFFNFNSTIHFKNTQNNKVVELFNNGGVKEGDYFLVMDAWNATAHQIRYMADLANINIKMGGIWHAGSYDDNDFLGRQFKDKEWSYALEKALYLLFDHNFFATQYHINLFRGVIGLEHKSFKIGFPMEYYSDIADELYFDPKLKEDLIVFPHRISSEKRPELFKEIEKICAEKYPHIKFIMCQEENLSKSEYHAILRKAKVVFSANKQETLGIGQYEGLLCGAIPYSPDHLSYSEMYSDYFLYDTKLIHWPTLLADLLSGYVNEYDSFNSEIHRNIESVTDRFFTGTDLYKIIGN